ncbi:yteA family sporulation protein, partial [Bacillus cereus]|nr:yteA family sporulation protein [Bacillus cereus]
MLTPQQVGQLKSILEKQKQQLDQTIQTHEKPARPSQRDAVGELSSIDN